MEDLKTRLRFLYETEIQEIIEDAEKQSSKIIEDAKKKAEEIKSQKRREILQRMQEKETSILSLAKIEEKKKIARAKSQLLEETVVEAMKRLSELGTESESNHWASLERLIVEAATALNGTEFEILTNKRDRKYVKENITKLEKKISNIKKTSVRLLVAGEELRSSGGVVVRTKDGRQSFNNSWEARLSKVKEEKTNQIFELLFKGAED
jgi:V/A-type H+-transporting ATPase subunit E